MSTLRTINVIHPSGTTNNIVNDASGNVTIGAGLTVTGTLTGSTGVMNIGSGQIYKDSSGNVGIGTSSPAQKLDVNGLGRMRFSSGTGAGHFLDTIGNASRFFTGTDAITEAWRIYDLIGGENRIYLDSSGNVGIGTSSPSSTFKTTISYSDNVFGGGLYVVNTNTGANAIASIQVRANNAGVSGVQLYQGVTGDGGLMNFNNSPLLFGTNNAERMRIDSSGNVGIGTSSPSQALTLGGASANIQISPAITTNNALVRLTNGGGNAYMGLDNSASGLGAAYGLHMYHAGAYPILFSTNNTERMRIDSSGNVGIGTSSPTSFGAGAIMQTVVGTTGYGGYLGSTNSVTVQLWANEGGLTGYVGTRTNHPIVLSVNNAECARIDTSGNLLVGTTSDVSAVGGKGVMLFAPSGTSGRINIGKSASGTLTAQAYYYSGTAVGSITYSDTATAYNTSSDYRLKNSVTPMTTGLATVSALKPVTYKWNADDSDGEGFIAHELQSVIPHAVTGEKDAVDDEGNIVPQGVDYSKIVVHLVAAIQEQQAQIEELKARLSKGGL